MCQREMWRQRGGLETRASNGVQIVALNYIWTDLYSRIRRVYPRFHLVNWVPVTHPIDDPRIERLLNWAQRLHSTGCFRIVYSDLVTSEVHQHCAWSDDEDYISTWVCASWRYFTQRISHLLTQSSISNWTCWAAPALGPLRDFNMQCRFKFKDSSM